MGDYIYSTDNPIGVCQWQYLLPVCQKSSLSGILKLSGKYVRGEEGRETGGGTLWQDNCEAEKAELWTEQRTLWPSFGVPKSLRRGLQRRHHQPAWWVGCGDCCCHDGQPPWLCFCEFNSSFDSSVLVCLVILICSCIGSVNFCLIYEIHLSIMGYWS